MEARPDPPLSEQLRKLPSAVRATVQAARRAAKAAAPKGTREIAYRSQPPRSPNAMWKLVRYAIEGADGYAVGIGAFSDHASLFFSRGCDLDDDSGLLEGRGKQFRFISLRSSADAIRVEVRTVLRAAFRLASPSAARGKDCVVSRKSA